MHLFTVRMPQELTRAQSYQELRENLLRYAEIRERSEWAEHRGRGACRTHYRAYASFERDVSRERIQAMVDEWIEKCFPKARVVYAVHRDTAHTHVHLWMDARGEDGKKIHLSDRQYRRIDEAWNRIYSRELGRPEREHLLKKQETHEYRQAKARGQEAIKPGRVRNNTRQMYLRREERNFGAYDHHQDPPHRDQRAAPERAFLSAPGERQASRTEPALDRASGECAGFDRAVSEACRLREELAREGQQRERAVSGLERVHRELSRVGEKARGAERGENLERER